MLLSRPFAKLLQSGITLMKRPLNKNKEEEEEEEEEAKCLSWWEQGSDFTRQ